MFYCITKFSYSWAIYSGSEDIHRYSPTSPLLCCDNIEDWPITELAGKLIGSH